MKSKTIAIIILVSVLALTGTIILINHKSARHIVKVEEGLKSVGNNNWQINCHYIYSDNTTSNKHIATLNTNNINYGELEKQAMSKC